MFLLIYEETILIIKEMIIRRKRMDNQNKNNQKNNKTGLWDYYNYNIDCGGHCAWPLSIYGRKHIKGDCVQ